VRSVPCGVYGRTISVDGKELARRVERCGAWVKSHRCSDSTRLQGGTAVGAERNDESSSNNHRRHKCTGAAGGPSALAVKPLQPVGPMVQLRPGGRRCMANTIVSHRALTTNQQYSDDYLLSGQYFAYRSFPSPTIHPSCH